MKNKYLKGAHLSERKFKEILRLFADDLTATQIADISGVSRVTINSYLKKLRNQIARFCEAQHPAPVPVVAYDNRLVETQTDHDGDTLVAVKTEVDRIVKPVIFGICRIADRLHTEILPDVSRPMIHAATRGRSVLETLDTTERLRRFNGVVDLGQYRLYRLGSSTTDTVNGGPLMDEVDAFWGLTKHRLAKFKGLNRNTAYLHLKECEYRFNHRNEDLYSVLLELLKNFPLTLS
ncbi:LuxR C-terminal-related transcriptional regulator [Chitinophaga varians]|uniref:LuxR C-terminal-related transcriptional regulator n=1 Tax=Chitinophaga varians TaxID=2202339 RepID=UPI00165F93A3|nr:LuxR C-terminal-related transcriptional regulator [Chitinophaga varians]MBC9911260.1 HTH domain-containing protein [Chitinophaga varians]